MSTVEIKMHDIEVGLIDARHAAEDLNGKVLDLDAKGGTRRPEVAEATRSLLALADRLDLLAALTRQEYWRVKGQRRLDDAIDNIENPSLPHYL